MVLGIGRLGSVWGGIQQQREGHPAWQGGIKEKESEKPGPVETVSGFGFYDS